MAPLIVTDNAAIVCRSPEPGPERLSAWWPQANLGWVLWRSQGTCLAWLRLVVSADHC